ncbi:putative PAP-specific phosphatase, mitochondrial isoform X2 [Magnolia sinica]|uniref:putative PAP-specific phosphatase, mitochondrial isoform X2 n=1 Tax=Magnolia sinica TaxID=86752 RepID=UPI002658CBE0|nr:putative PAP-specific phosphatase, mitochondrial isoform X2 [Magnolia sinica]
MNLLLHSCPPLRFSVRLLQPPSHSSRFTPTRSSLPFPPQKAKHYKELEAAVDAVQRACSLCIDVKRSLFSGDGRILEKNDRTPVTIADFGVQALISLELSRSFPSIPLVAEEDSGFLRSNPLNSTGDGGYSSNFLVDSVLSAIIDKASAQDEPLTHDIVLDAIDRGGKDSLAFGVKPATYWVLDPIDGTRGFLKGNDALYVVGLALVVDGEIALGVMGCPNWPGDSLTIKEASGEALEAKTGTSGPGVIMVAHVGCGTWKKRLPEMLGSVNAIHDSWVRCFVDGCSLVYQACFCIPESHTWDSLPLSLFFSSTTDADGIANEREVLLLQTCCGSLCKYLMIASGRASVFIQQARQQTVIKVWDHAVGMICVHEAGGQVTDWKGSQLDLAADQLGRRVIIPSGGVLVTNGILHQQILEIISSSSPVV